MIFDKWTGEAIGYSQEERNSALEVSLSSLASAMGYTVIREGRHYSLKEMDSLIIYNDRSWNRWSGKGNITGGTQIDFLLAFGDVSTAAQAIKKLLDFRGYHTEAVISHKNIEMQPSASESIHDLVLPPKNKDYRRVFAYLIKTRGLSQEVVSDFVHRKLIYEDSVHHNIVFLGYDPEGNIKYAGLRGTADLYGKKFKMDVPGNDKNYGVNIVNKENDTLLVFESVIDCMSYIDLYHDNVSNKLVLGMVEDNPLAQFVKDYSHIKKIRFCLDNDEAGHKALYGWMDQDGTITRPGLISKYKQLGFDIDVLIPPHGKDWNETVLFMRNEKNKERIAAASPEPLPVIAPANRHRR